MNTSNSHERNERRDLTILKVDSVGRWYPEGSGYLCVLREASMEIRSGEMVALIAPSGSGKSTLLHIVGLLERPDEGDIIIGNEKGHTRTTELSDNQRTAIRREKIGFVYQFHHLLPEFTALENVIIPQMIRGLDWQTASLRATELLICMELSSRLNHRPSELSGGEQQRVAIARALANVPDLILADEPTGNLDPKTAEYIFTALTTIVKESGLAALIATHNMELAERMDRRVTLIDGKIEEV